MRIPNIFFILLPLIFGVIIIYTSGNHLLITSILIILLILLSFYNYFYRKSLFNRCSLEKERLQTSIDHLKKEYSIKENLHNTFNNRLTTFLILERCIEDINTVKESEEGVWGVLPTMLVQMYPQIDTILIYKFDHEMNYLHLKKSIKKENVIIKEKRGDIIDWWVLKNNKFLIIEDICSDFRFDVLHTLCYSERGVQSLIVAPIGVGDKILGLIRLESVNKNAFSVEEARILQILCNILGVVLDRIDIYKKIEEFAIKDPLTNVYLKSYFIEKIKEWGIQSSKEGKIIGIGFLDIDNFKKINDLYGHIIGDKVILSLIEVMNNILKRYPNHIIGRYGGEEFVFGVYGINIQDMLSIGEQIRKSTSTTDIIFRRKSTNFTVSIGIAFFPKDGSTVEEVLKVADDLLCNAKNTGKNKICSTVN